MWAKISNKKSLSAAIILSNRLLKQSEIVNHLFGTWNTLKLFDNKNDQLVESSRDGRQGHQPRHELHWDRGQGSIQVDFVKLFNFFTSFNWKIIVLIRNTIWHSYVLYMFSISNIQLSCAAKTICQRIKYVFKLYDDICTQKNDN